ncbi:hypothetical protein HNY73_007763 [Argiope bruennichi]|uniref:Uncharacterized protein n=1 Tax=Argiope bruennichi TaxID=94029 RepID=A0A8T0FEZ8_ARGBR|nr:hypothetical protein HNY73_007763 [Argiope bruennichi]
MSTPSKVSGNLSLPATALLVSPPKTIALPSAVLSPRSPSGTNVGPPLPLSPDKMCMGNNLSALDRVQPPSPNSDPSTALNCPPRSPLATDESADLVAAPVSGSLSPGTTTTAGNLPHVVPCPEEKPDKDACFEAHPPAPYCPDELPNFSLGSLVLPNFSSEGSPDMAHSPPTSLEDQLFLSPSPEKQDVQEVVNLSDSPVAKVPNLPSEWTKMFLGLLSGPPRAKAFSSLPPVVKSTCKYCELPSPLAHRVWHRLNAPPKSPLDSDPPEQASSPAKPNVLSPPRSSRRSVPKKRRVSLVRGCYVTKTSCQPSSKASLPVAFFSMRSAYVLHKCPKSPAASSAPGDTSSRFCCACKILFVDKRALREHNYNVQNPLRPAQPSVPVVKAAPPTHQSKVADRSNSSSCLRNLSGALGVSSSSTPPEPRPLLPCADCNFLAKTRKGLRFHRYRQHSVPIAKRFDDKEDRALNRTNVLHFCIHTLSHNLKTPKSDDVLPHIRGSTRLSTSDGAESGEGFGRVATHRDRLGSVHNQPEYAGRSKCTLPPEFTPDEKKRVITRYRLRGASGSDGLHPVSLKRVLKRVVERELAILLNMWLRFRKVTMGMCQLLRRR